LRPAGLDDAEVCIPAGTFTMGSAAERVPQGYIAHGPEHQVTLAAYVLDMYEVTVSRYRACVSGGGCVEPSTTVAQGCTYTAAASDRDHFPVTCVSWDDADAFCAWDGARRLPTEAEWERAARGTTGTTYAWGNDDACAKAVFGGGGATPQCSVHAGTTPKAAGSAPRGASLEGAMDLTGNAWEWVYDYFSPYSSSAADNPLGADSGSVRIQRGGNWLTSRPDAAAYMRRAESPQAIGPSSFRCAHGAP
jgi:sulfatase modifying factor 1